MAGNNFYYQIMIVLSHKSEKLLYWIRNEKINYSNNGELIKFIKENCSELKKYKSIKEIYASNITEEQFKEIDKWYVQNSKPRDYIVIHDE